MAEGQSEGTVVAQLKFEIMLQDLEVICGLVRYPASLLHCSRPVQGGVRALIMLLGPKALLCL